MDHQTAVDQVDTADNLAWHYTTLNALTEILATNSLLATEIGFQNDLTEHETADKALEQALVDLCDDPQLGRFAENARAFLREIDRGARWEPRNIGGVGASRFVLCGSSEPDCLYIWRTYGFGSSVGCAIGLDRSAPLGIASPPDRLDQGRSRTRTLTGASVGQWTAVDYDFAHVVDVANRQLRELGKAYLAADRQGDEFDSPAFGLLIKDMDRIRSFVRSFAKNEGFVDEHEVRVTVEDVAPGPHVFFTPSRSGPRPHIRLVAAQAWGESVAPNASSRTEALLPIRAVRLGPNAPRTAAASVKWLLVSHGYRTEAQQTEDDEFTWEDSVLVLDSRHPFRSI